MRCGIRALASGPGWRLAGEASVGEDVRRPADHRGGFSHEGYAGADFENVGGRRATAVAARRGGPDRAVHVLTPSRALIQAAGSSGWTRADRG